MTKAELEKLEAENAQRSADLRYENSPVTQRQLHATIRAMGRGGLHVVSRGPSLSAILRGMHAMKGRTITPESANADVEIVKALAPGSAPGSVLVPVETAGMIGDYVALAGAVRAAGARVFPMDDSYKKTLPIPAIPATFEWLAPNAIQTAQDVVLDGATGELKERRALLQLSTQLLRTSSPAVESVLAEMFGVAAAQNEDSCIFSATDVTSGPKCLYATSGITKFNSAGNNPNGGSLLYSDLIAAIRKAFDAKVHAPWVWFGSPRVFERIYSLATSTSAPFLIPRAVPVGPASFDLFGWPLFVTPAIPENLTVGSGTNQTCLYLTNPHFLNLFSQSFELAISNERLLDANSTLIRVVQSEDVAYRPATGVVCLTGIA